MTKEATVLDPINPDLAVALASAAGLDPSDLKAQIARQQAGDDDPDKLRARIAQLEQELAAIVGSEMSRDVADETEPTAPQPHELLAQRLHDAQSEWITLGGPGGSGDGQA
jgi:hypothetical protein